MPEMNNFKQLEKLQSEEFKNSTDKVKKNVTNSIASFGLMANVVELYFSRMFEVFVDLTNTTSSKSNDDIDKK